MELCISSLDFSYNSKKVLKNVSFGARSGEVLGVIGPNGSGKTTLLKCMRMAVRPQKGKILLDLEDVSKWRRQKIAQYFGVVPQSSSITFPFNVLDVVMMGRMPHLSRFQREKKSDVDVVHEAMHLTSIEHLYDRPISKLSGGEFQRVIIARALAQQPKILLLDEPTSQLDINHQFEIMKLIRELARKKDMMVIIISHNLNHSLRYCDSLLLLNDGCVHSCGDAEKVLTTKNIKEVYGVEAELNFNTKIDSYQVTLIDVVD
ncbi:MAG: ABC transporter ATP-binding protein [Candidatus Methanofastidiosia archaeon]